MKYKRIIWWQKSNDDGEILLAKEECDNKGINLIIVDNFNDFVNLIDPESFIVLSVHHADTHLEEIETVLKSHPTQKFYLHWRMDEDDYNLNQYKLIYHSNVVKPEDYSLLLRYAQE